MCSRKFVHTFISESLHSCFALESSRLIVCFFLGSIERVLIAVVNGTTLLYVNNESSGTVWPGNCHIFS